MPEISNSDRAAIFGLMPEHADEAIQIAAMEKDKDPEKVSDNTLRVAQAFARENLDNASDSLIIRVADLLKSPEEQASDNTPRATQRLIRKIGGLIRGITSKKDRVSMERTREDGLSMEQIRSYHRICELLTECRTRFENEYNL